ncbi:phosphoglycolate phosphatase [Aliidiomarina sp. Khilg15.8]
MKCAVLFDLDGTLLDTAPDLHRALNAVLETNAYKPVSLEQARPVASHGATGLLRLGFGDAYAEANREKLRQQFLQAYAEDVSSRTRYFAGVETLLRDLTNAGIAYGIVTNKPTQFTQSLLPAFPLLARSAAVVCGDTLAVAKPDPAPLIHAAELLKIEPAHCWYVGDAERDIVAGRGAGMKTVLARYGYLTDEDLAADWQADFSVQHANEVISLLKT